MSALIEDELFERGRALRRAMFGVAGTDQELEATTELDEKLQEMITRYCFGDVWQRDGLSRRERSLITVAMLIALGRPHEVRIHLRGGLANGLTVEELREVIVQSTMYCGLPAALDGLRQLKTVEAEQRQRPAAG